MKKTVIIAAAGRGTRLSADLPKCLVKINEHSILEYQLKAFEKFDEIRLVVGYKSNQVAEFAATLRSDLIFIENKDYENTTTLQSMYLAAVGINGKALFVDGDMVLSKKTSAMAECACLNGDDFIAVASELSDTPVYAGVKNNAVTWFSFDEKAKYEWANMAYIDCAKLEYNQTHFFVQLQKFLPMTALEIERMEVDTPNDLKSAEQAIMANPEKYDFWR